MKKNDYIIASINNPDFTAEDFRNVAGYSLKDTQMLKEEDYLSNDFIKSNPLFQDSTGTFRKELFSEFYKEKLKDFNDFSNEDFADSYQYSPFDTRRKGKDKVSAFGLTFFNNPNPTMQSIGIEGPNVLGERMFSDREIAQKQRIFDTASGKFEDLTPNDQALVSNPLGWFKSLVEDPLVLAIYDEAGEHMDPITGRMTSHKKGQYKLNDKGLPYYERLNGRSLIGRDILSATDTLTVDGNLLNKYDFLDSDGLDKSVSGVIMKTAAAIAPIFTPAAPYYAGFLVLRELGKTAPMLYGMGTALFNDNTNSKLTNTIAAYMEKLTTSTSDYAKNHMFSLENFGNLIADVALQWEQQQAIVKAYQKLNRATEARIKAAEAKALADYERETTALIQEAKLGNVSVNRVRELTGATNTKELQELLKGDKWKLTTYGRAAQEQNVEAIRELIRNRGIFGQNLSLGYMALISNTDVYQSALEHGASKQEAAMLAVGSTAGMFSVDKWLGLGEMFFQYPEERAILRRSILDETHKALNNFKATKPGDIGKFFKIGSESARKTLRDYHTQIKDRSLPLIGKAIGEGLEEVSEELVTDLTKSMGELAAKLGFVQGPTDLGAFDNVGDRYLMSLFGGAIGGGIFGLKSLGIENNAGVKSLQLLVRQGKANELRKELKSLYDKGDLGSTNLSIQYQEDKDKKKVFVSADEKNISQNEYVYKLLSQGIDQLENIIEAHNLDKTEEDLFKQLVLKDDRYMRLQSFLMDKSYITGYQERFQDLVESIARKQSEINAAGDKKEDTITLENDLKAKLLERDRFLNGELSLEYLDKMLFALNPAVSKGFVQGLNLDEFSRTKTGVPFMALDTGAKMTIMKQWTEYLAAPHAAKKDVTEGFAAFKDLTRTLGQNIADRAAILEDGYTAWEHFSEQLEHVQKSLAWTWDTQLDGESDEDYANRDTAVGEEDPVALRARQAQRIEAIEAHNNEVKNWLQQFLNSSFYIDSTTKRRLTLLLDRNSEQIKRELLKQYVPDAELQTAIIRGQNPEEAILQLREQKKKEIADQLWSAYNQEGFGLGTIPTFNPDTEEMEESQIPIDNVYDEGNLVQEGALIQEDKRRVLQEMQARTMSKLGMDKFNIETLYNALGENPIQKFYELQNTILQEMMNEGIYLGNDFVTINVENHPVANLLAKYAEGLQAIDPSLSEEERKSALSDLVNQYSLTDIRETAIDAVVAQQLNEWEKNVPKQAQEIADQFENNEILQLVQQVKQKIVTTSPALDIMHMISQRMGEQVNIEELLSNLMERWEDQVQENEFEMTPQEKEQLAEAKQLIEIAKSLVASQYKESFLGEAMSYNKALNDFVRAHKGITDNWEDLPILKRRTGELLYHSLDMYAQEIDKWIEVANRNTDNKLQNLENTRQAYNDVRQNFLTTDFGSHWLLEGAQDSNLPTMEVMIYRNAKKAMEQGKTLEEILQDVLKQINMGEAIINQLTSDMDSNLNYGNFTAYDRFMYIASLIAADRTGYYKAERDFLKSHSNIAPLVTQEPSMLYAYALWTNPEAIYKAIDTISDYAKEQGYDLPPIYGLIITGIGGAGKTAAVASFAYNESETTWLSGPTDTQIQGLKKVATKGIGKSKEDLFNYILGGKPIDYIVKKGKGIDGRNIISVNSQNLNTANAPKHLIIDEATHFSNAELQILSQWARKAGVRLTLIGDENQKGNAIQEVYNLAREHSTGFRSPRLAITLRTGNLWKTKNQNELVKLMNALRNSGEGTTEKVRQNVEESLKKEYRLEYWENESDIHGDKVVKELTTTDLSKLKGKEVAYIGNDPDSVKELDNVQAFKSLDDIQGREFDYVIFDYNIGGKIDYTDPLLLLDAMRDLYTGISRSRVGSIIIDRDGSLSDITNRKQKYTTNSVNLSEESITALANNRINEIEEILKSIPEEEKTKEETNKEEPKKEKKEPKKDKAKKAVEEEELPEEDFNGEYRAYSSVMFLGGANVEDFTLEIPGWGKGKLTRWIANGNRRDIGIFASEGLLAKDPEEKAKLVLDLHRLRSIFTFDKFTEGKLSREQWNRLPNRVKELFNGPEDFNDIHYFVVAEDLDPNKHQLIGMSELEQKKLSFMKGKDGKDKVISIQARIKGKDGIEYTITLGGAANPATWEAYIESQNAPEDPIELEVFNKKQKEHKAALKQYKKDLEDLVNINQEVEIEKPKFTGQTRLINIGDKIRLGDLYGEKSRWEKITANFTVSPVYVVVEDLKGINDKLSSDLKGHPVVFVSADPTLNPEKLRDIWERQQKYRDESNLTVRMVVLDNVGVSFNSLHKKGFEEVYKATFLTTAEGEEAYTIPYEKEPEAIRMFAAMWNYRANLKMFNKAVKTLLDATGWTEKELNDKLKIGRDLYLKAKNEDGIKTYEQFGAWLENHSELEGVDVTLAIRKFNEDLQLRQFRLGWSKDGASIQHIYGLTEESPYGKKNDVYGTFITPDLARQYEDVLDRMFEALVNPAFSETVKDLTTSSSNIAEQNIWLTEEKWYDQLVGERTLKFGTDEGKVVTVNAPSEETLKSFSLAMIKLPKNLRKKALKGKDAFFKLYNATPEEGKNPAYRIYLEINGEKKAITYTGIDEAFEFNGQRGILGVSTKARDGLYGEITAEWDPDKHEGVPVHVDTRMDTFFSLMFHGVVAESEFNDFIKSSRERHDSLAAFPQGIFSDAQLAPKTEERFVAKSVTSEALFATDAIPSNPLFSFSMKKKVDEAPAAEVDEEIKDESLQTEIKSMLAKIKSIIGRDLVSDAVADTITSDAIYNLVQQYNANLLKNPALFDPAKIIIYKDLELKTLLDLHPELNGFTNSQLKDGRIMQVKVGDETYNITKVLDDYVVELDKVDKPVKEEEIVTYTLKDLRDFITNYFNKHNPESVTQVTNFLKTIIKRNNLKLKVDKDYNFKVLADKASTHFNTDEDLETLNAFKKALELFKKQC